MAVLVKGKKKLDAFLEDEWHSTNDDKSINDNTKAICYWLYIVIKTIVAIFVVN